MHIHTQPYHPIVCTRACEKKHRFWPNDTTVHKICISTVFRAGAWQCCTLLPLLLHLDAARERVISRDSTRTYTHTHIKRLLSLCVCLCVPCIQWHWCNVQFAFNWTKQSYSLAIRIDSWYSIASRSLANLNFNMLHSFFCNGQRVAINLVHFFHLLPLSSYKLAPSLLFSTFLSCHL